MARTLDIDPGAQELIRALPPEALVALGEAFEVLTPVPERDSPLNRTIRMADCPPRTCEVSIVDNTV
ncbi:hypothetical protein [Saccharothrix yanglingensis]|uniref:Uncharacterized protein n=1 Tax=Saccharothrix yanglingensis TaxID=659496 RepID=A0ABU0XB04_9PSEU|nr:hypothetical protein [Saccharothrix yanglingensis]MDQ2589146.1 hypothetical protein [Saccharothrix yanglingensis]